MASLLFLWGVLVSADRFRSTPSGDSDSQKSEGFLKSAWHRLMKSTDKDKGESQKDSDSEKK